MSFEIFTASKNLVLLAVTIFVTLSSYFLIDPEHNVPATFHQEINLIRFDTSSTFNGHSENASNGTQSHAVVHMGPPKTGSTTIQLQSKALKEYLALDGFEMPWEVRERKHGSRPILQKTGAQQNQIHFTSCFHVDEDQRDRATCDPDLLLFGSDIAARDRNIFVSNEGWGGMNDEGIDLLASYLSQWQRTTIVLVYRRYYDWIASQYNQHRKVRRLGDTSKWETSILDYVSLRIHKVPYNHVSKSTKRLREKFDRVLVLNLHDRSRGGPDESLFCDPELGMTHTCGAVRGQDKSMHSNPKVNLDYSNLAYGAKLAGMAKIQSDEAMKRVAGAVQDHHVGALNGKPFARVCPPQSDIDLLWNMTYEFEAMFFPERVDSRDNDLRSDFEKSASTKLCKVDVEHTLGEEEWQDFFGKLEP